MSPSPIRARSGQKKNNGPNGLSVSVPTGLQGSSFYTYWGLLLIYFWDISLDNET